MEKKFSLALGAGLSLLTLSGFTQRTKTKRFLGLMNVDTQHSAIRLPLIAAVLYAGSQQSTLKDTRTVLSFVGMFYLAVGTIGFVDKSLGAVLPSKLTNFDLVYHFGVGAVALWLGRRSGRMLKQ